MLTMYAIETYNSLWRQIGGSLNMKATNKEYAYKLRQLRKQKGLSIYGISKRTGISAGYLSEIETGKNLIECPGTQPIA